MSEGGRSFLEKLELNTLPDRFDKNLSLNDAAAILEISPATLRNWVKLGVVSSQANLGGFKFDETHIIEIRNRIADGSIERLRKRANKNQSGLRHAHSELLNSEDAEKKISIITDEFKLNTISILNRFYVCSLVDIGLISLFDLETGNLPKKIKEELNDWGVNASYTDYLLFYEKCKSLNIDFSEDILGYIYQWYCSVGDKQRSGSYYTPPSLVQKIVSEAISGECKFLDPCCGSGNFIQAAIKRLTELNIEDPYLKVYGLDIDRTAVLVTRANLTLASRGRANSTLQILQADAIFENPFNLDFEVICTNPPWGAAFTPEYETKLKNQYNKINSGESFSYFLVSSMKKLNESGVLTFVLPESILNVKTHRDVREYIFDNFCVTSVNYVEEKFSGVFTKAITLCLKKRRPAEEYFIKLNSTLISSTAVAADSDLIIPLGSDKLDLEVIELIEAGPKITLKGASDWALGIVTGDNERFISDSPKVGYEPILKGTDIYRFKVNKPSNYIQFIPDELQQVAPSDKYRTSEKLVYRFICKELVFAVDRSSLLTLNSANVLIPQLPNYSAASICGIFNSKLGQFYYQKKFNSIKTLRGNLERFPLPDVTEKELREIDTLVKKIETEFNQIYFDQLNEAVMDLYKIPNQLRDTIRSVNLSRSFDSK